MVSNKTGGGKGCRGVCECTVLKGFPLLKDWLGICWLVVSDCFCITSPLAFYLLSSLYLNPGGFFSTFAVRIFLSYPAGGEWANGWVVFSCLLRLIHNICLSTYIHVIFPSPKQRLFSMGLHQLLAFLQFKEALCVLISHTEHFLFWSAFRSTVVSSKMLFHMSSLHSSEAFRLIANYQ